MAERLSNTIMNTGHNKPKHFLQNYIETDYDIYTASKNVRRIPESAKVRVLKCIVSKIFISREESENLKPECKLQNTSEYCQSINKEWKENIKSQSNSEYW